MSDFDEADLPIAPSDGIRASLMRQKSYHVAAIALKEQASSVQKPNRRTALLFRRTSLQNLAESRGVLELDDVSICGRRQVDLDISMDELTDVRFVAQGAMCKVCTAQYMGATIAVKVSSKILSI